MENISYGGATTHLISLLNSFKFRNYEILIITNKTNNAKREILKLSKNKSIKLLIYNSLNAILVNNYFLKIFFLFFGPIFFILSIFQMFLILKKNKFDILLGNCGGYGNFRTEMAAIVAGKFLKKKV